MNILLYILRVWGYPACNFKGKGKLLFHMEDSYGKGAFVRNEGHVGEVQL